MENLSSWVNSISSICHATEQNLAGYRRINNSMYSIQPPISVTSIMSPIKASANSSYIVDSAYENQNLPNISLDISQVRSRCSHLVDDSTNHWKGEIQSLREQLGYIEAKCQQLEEGTTHIPRQCDNIEFSVTSQLGNIQKELEELACDNDLGQLAEVAENMQDKSLLDMQTQVDYFTQKIDESAPRISEEIAKAATSADPMKKIQRKVIQVGEDMIQNFSHKSAKLLKNLKREATDLVNIEAENMGTQVERYRTQAMSEITNTIKQCENEAKSMAEGKQTKLSLLKTVVDENHSTEAPLKNQITSVEDNLAQIHSVATKENSKFQSTLSQIKAQHESTLVALSDLHTKLDVLKEKKAAGRHETNEGAMEIHDRIDIISAKVDRVQSNLANGNAGPAVAKDSSRVDHLEERMENIIDTVNAIESSWMEHTHPTQMGISLPPGLGIKDEKEATFGKEKRPKHPSPELMTISLTDYGESDNESVIDFLSPKESPLNRIPGAPTGVSSVFNFNDSRIPEIEEEYESEDLQSEEEEIDIKDVTRGLFERVLKEEMAYWLAQINAGIQNSARFSEGIELQLP